MENSMIFKNGRQILRFLTHGSENDTKVVENVDFLVKTGPKGALKQGQLRTTWPPDLRGPVPH